MTAEVREAISRLAPLKKHVIELRLQGRRSLTLYNEHHFFAPNDMMRYSLGTKNKGLKTNDDGSLTLYVQADPPEDGKRANWLPAPIGDFSLYVRCYWPDAAITEGRWTQPAVNK
jgi:hypothetical protein